MRHNPAHLRRMQPAGQLRVICLNLALKRRLLERLAGLPVARRPGHGHIGILQVDAGHALAVHLHARPQALHNWQRHAVTARDAFGKFSGDLHIAPGEHGPVSAAQVQPAVRQRMPDIVRYAECLPQPVQQLKAGAAVGEVGDRRGCVLGIRHLNCDAALLCQPAANLFQCRVLHGAWPQLIEYARQLAHEEALKAVFRRLGALNVPGKPAQQQIGIAHINPH